ncbi:DNA polymerase kappa [Phytophthora nicotianae]|uniref:DNA polymerase kappa n=1 Tax=Phytophthora nicotianae TaxID=4792 RepID=A0A0W8DBV9_PHYNI|nr:DNA polymerase kappa [Phytophthora nicotianae]
MVNLHVKTTAGKKFSVDVALDSSVLQCKEALVTPTEVPAALQRLIYKGKVLKDDQTLESYGIQAEDTIYFVKGSARPARPATTTPAATSTTPMPAPAPAATPAPAAAPAAAANPFNFPLFPGAAGTGAGAASNDAANDVEPRVSAPSHEPQNMQAMMQMQNAMNQLRGSGLIPGLEGMNLGAGTGAGTGTTGATGVTNPAAANPFAMFGGLPGSGFGAASTPAAPAGNPEEIYASQLTQLNDMGFSDRDRNIRALQATFGNVQAAVDRLLSGSI